MQPVEAASRAGTATENAPKPMTLAEILAEIKTRPAEEVWKSYFAQRPPADQTRRIVSRLHSQRNHTQVIHALRAALLSGQAEPWMYEVLALSMEIEGHPKKEVERVLLSMTDFNARDVQNLLASGIYLMRLGAGAQALKLFRQVSLLQPTRPEPYTLGLRLADEQKDVEAVLWAARGVLTHFWFNGYEKQHEVATRMLRDWQLRMQQAGNPEMATRVETTLREASQRDLELKLTWSGEADLDLIVGEPLGTECSYGDRYTESGGALLHDGAGPTQSECYEHYVCAYAASGYYTVTVSHSTGKIVGNRARLEVIRYRGTDHEQRETINVLFTEPTRKYRISLHQGRRTARAPVFLPESDSTTSQRQRRQTLTTLAQLRQQAARTGQVSWTGTLNQLQTSPVGAVGYSPVISTVNSGINLTAHATVSADRRYVRLGVQPAFTDITDVFTFSFAGAP